MNKNIRNFCIIAHIDHGKSTLADRMIELTNTVEKRRMQDQLLDSMDLERERGITIKLQPVRMQWKEVTLNLIDTPGHIDFNYEVSRSLAAVEGAILLVDATQGIQAQTLANLYLALDYDLEIIPVINKIDLPAADVERVAKEIIGVLGCKREDILAISGKTGENVEHLLDKIVATVPQPKIEPGTNVQGLIFDAQYDEFKGVVIYTRLFAGSIAKGDTVIFLGSSKKAEVIDIGHFTPSMASDTSLDAGQIGYVITNIKDIEKTRVGDTIGSSVSSKPLKGYREVRPMVFAGIYPNEGSDYEKLRKAIDKLKLNDASLVFEPDRSDVLGFGFRCGFLGLLHLEIFQERLLREYNLEVVVTAPTVAYHVYLKSGEKIFLTSPGDLPDENHLERVEQPIAKVDLITPKEYLGPIMDYIQKRKGVYLNTEYIDESRVILHYSIPLSSIVIDFYDTIKNLSSGYASYTYEVTGYEQCSLVRLDILVAEEKVPGLATLAPKEDAEAIGRSVVTKLKDLIPKAQFVIKLQATIGGKIIASERISALRKDVTAKLYGGDVTRKRKLLEKQKKGKKKMGSSGRVEIPQKAYLALLKRN